MGWYADYRRKNALIKSDAIGLSLVGADIVVVWVLAEAFGLAIGIALNFVLCQAVLIAFGLVPRRRRDS